MTDRLNNAMINTINDAKKVVWNLPPAAQVHLFHSKLFSENLSIFHPALNREKLFASRLCLAPTCCRIRKGYINGDRNRLTHSVYSRGFRPVALAGVSSPRELLHDL